MLKGIRNLYRSALDNELGVVGGEIIELQGQLEALIERYHRLQARIGMRELRSRKDGNGDGELVMQLRAAAANETPPSGKGNGEWPEAR